MNLAEVTVDAGARLNATLPDPLALIIVGITCAVVVIAAVVVGWWAGK